MKSYKREMDLDATSSRVDMVRVQNGMDQMQTQTIQPNSPWTAQYDFWITPFGFLKGAMTHSATVKPETVLGEKYNVVSFTVQDKYRVNGYVNEKNLVEKVETWLDNDVLGDMLVQGVYLQYQDFGGLKFPTTIIQKQGGFNTLILIVDNVKPNAPVNIQPQQTQAAPVPQPVTVQSEKIADGIYYLRGGTHHSVAVEFADHVVLIEAPQNEARSLAVMAELRKLVPNKPIRYLVNTHHHFDHSGGLRTYVDAGVTIITHDINKAFYEKALTAPRTLNPDRLAQSKKKPVLETFKDKKVLSDATRTLELHHIVDNPHNDGILMAYLPKEKILIEVDVYTPPNPGAALPATPNPNTVNLVENVERLKLDFDRILPLHGPGVATKADLYKAAGRQAAGN
jgi:glyoxylase-like metal-dependent hydrolase (beta-lactamase superfamily II)